MKKTFQKLLVGLMVFAGSHYAFAQAIDDANTVLSYQGLLSRQTNDLAGSYDFVFNLYGTNIGGSLVASPITNTGITISSNGLFSTMLDFGAGPFTGSTGNWLEIGIRTNGGSTFTVLSPRQLVTSAPRAIYAANAGTAAMAATATNFVGTVGGDVSGPQGALIVTTVGGQTAASIASAAMAANSATSSNLPNTIVLRDGSGGFSAGTVQFTGVPHVPVLPLAPGSVALDGNLYLPFPATIFSGTNTVFVEEGSTFVGIGAGFGSAPNNHDVGVGDYVLSSSSSGPFNTAIGETAMQYNTTGSNNTAGGFEALQFNTTGSWNKADGYQALRLNTNGSWNTGNGALALSANTSGSYNTASGGDALQSNTTGSRNTANGMESLSANTTGNLNTANGMQSMASTTIGSYNAANGATAMFHNTSGSNNTANGYSALFNLGNNGGSPGNNTADGFAALGQVPSGNNNIAVGYMAGFSFTGSESENIDLGNQGSAGDNNTIRIGTQGNQIAAYVAGISGSVVASNSLSVFVDSSGKLGTGGTLGLGQMPGNGAITVNAGTGLNGGGTVSLGGSLTLNNTGVLSVNGPDDITASTVGGVVTLRSDATSFDLPGTIVKRDINGDFSTHTISLDGVLNLLATTPIAGYVTLGGSPFLHAFGGVQNFFGGTDAGNLSMSGLDNTGVGYSALFANSTGSDNTAVGLQSLSQNTTGSFNTAIGVNALQFNATGSRNTANGVEALESNMTGDLNTASGHQALGSTVSGSFNMAEGAVALFHNTTGSNNAASGYGALANLGNNGGSPGNNTADGFQALGQVPSGTDNIAVGYMAGFNFTDSETSNIVVGNPGIAGDNNTIRIGVEDTQLNTYVAGIWNTTLFSNTLPVVVDSSGHLGVGSPSSARFKKDIADMADASSPLLSLRPVTFHYKKDAGNTPQFGVVAEEVEKADPQLVVHDAKGGLAGVRYEAINAMLLNEFLKEHRKVESQSAEIEALKARLDRLEKPISSK